jgi:hypothetical protein
MSQAVAYEVLAVVGDAAVSAETRMWLGHLRGEYVNAKAQDSMFQGES